MSSSLAVEVGGLVFSFYNTRQAPTKIPLEQRAHFYTGGKPCIEVRSARQTARTIDVRAVLRHSVPNKGLPPLRLRLSLRTCHMETVLTNHSQTTSLKIEHIT